MKCDDVLANLPDFVLGKVEPNLKRSVENHLQACSKCQAELAAMEKAVTVLGEIQREEYPEGFWQEMKACIMDRVSAPRAARWKVPAFAGGLAALLVVIGVGIYEYSLRPAQQALSIISLAASLPTEQVEELSNLNVTFLNTAVQPIDETEEINSVDDSLQLAVVKSMWSSVADSSRSLLDFDYTGDVFSN